MIGGWPYLLRHFFSLLCSPYFLALSLLAFLIVWLFVRGYRQWMRSGLLVVFIVFYLLGSGWFVDLFTDSLVRMYPPVEKVDPSIHWVVVFGGGQQRHVAGPVNQVLNDVSIQRLLEGVRLYRLLQHAKLILSGGGEPDVSESEAAHMAALASWFSIPRPDLVLESKSVNTVDEAIQIKQWVHQQPFYLVTSAIHMPRSMALCLEQGLNPVAAPADYPYDYSWNWMRKLVPGMEHFAGFTQAWHEILGMGWGFIRGRLSIN